MCGLCCQNISNVKELKDFALPNGVCRYYNYDTKGCNIYENRPNICNIDKMYELEYFKNYSKTEFYKSNADVCNFLQEEKQLNLNYRVDIKE